MIQVAKRLEKEAIESSGIDFIRLSFALFFMVAVLTYIFYDQRDCSLNATIR